MYGLQGQFTTCLHDKNLWEIKSGQSGKPAKVYKTFPKFPQ